jgi:hypothetical protein
MHIERLRQVKPTISIREPKKLGHMQVNYKKEMQNLGKLLFHRLIIILERMSEI